MRVPLVRAALVFSALALTAASGRSDGDPETDDRIQTGNKVVFDTGSPVSTGVGQLKASGFALKATGWTCDKVTIEVLNSENKVVVGVDKAATPAWSATFTGLNAGTYKVRATGFFSKGKERDEKPVTSSAVIVQ